LEKEIQEYERLKLMKEEEKEKKLEHKTQHK
jgi:hypothetical protein